MAHAGVSFLKSPLSKATKMYPKKSRRFLLPLFMVSACFSVFLFGCAETVAIRTAPPPLPYYEQPYCPGPGYLWVPGYWAYGPYGYYWVPGMWEYAPRIGWMWTPGYWGWSDGGYFWHSGYWGRHIGFYGGINYGYGYTGMGYEGGYWKDRVFYYNSAVSKVNITVVNNTYVKEVNSNAAPARTSFNGGTGGVLAKPTSQELIAAREPHIGPTAHQKQLHKSVTPKRIPRQNIKKDRKAKEQV
jgi:WXXGXW repeat (2 copies)